MHRTVTTTLGIVASLCLAGAVAHSGEKDTANVVVNTAAMTAYGSFGSARNSADTYQKLYCWVWSSDNGGLGFDSGGCYARDNNLKVSAMCSTVQPYFIRAIQAMRSDDYVWFGWDANGQCTYIRVYNGSEYAPKVL